VKKTSNGEKKSSKRKKKKSQENMRLCYFSNSKNRKDVQERDYNKKRY